MNNRAENRELFEVSALGNRILGTCHWPAGSDDGTAGAGKERRIGLVFLSGMGSTRSTNGDVAVFWAEVLAYQGYMFIRIDLPGYGDSEGNPPDDWVRCISEGRDAPVAAAAISEIAARFDLSQVVVIGHCSGTVSAILATAANKQCTGLVLMDAYFHLPLQKPMKARRVLHLWAARVGADRFLSDLYGRWKSMRGKLRGGSLPENANIPLLHAWKKVLSADMPVLMLKSPGRMVEGARTRPEEFNYAQYVMGLATDAAPNRECRVIAATVEGSHHSFANGEGRLGVLRYLEGWLSENFPVTGEQSSRIGAMPSKPETIPYQGSMTAI